MPEESIERIHHYQAEASVLSGSLRLPLVHEIRPQARIVLPAEGGYVSQRAENYRLEGVISFRSAYTQVAGNRGAKPGHGWATLTTTAIEGLNVLDVVTADRVVGQIITEHPLEGYVPSINLLGTRFENLRIAGHPVALDIDLNILGPRSEKDTSYSRDSDLVSRVTEQYNRVLENGNLPAETLERYNRLFSTLGASEAIECSLVNRASGSYPGRSFGHVIDVPDFGRIVLGKLTVTHEDFKPDTDIPKKTTVSLTMIDLEMGCAVEGNTPIGSGSSNGTTEP
jgi:hypothetical protein